MSHGSSEDRYKVLALYKFVKIDPDKVPLVQKEIESQLRKVKARGTILLASEGINGTICYSERQASTNVNVDDTRDSDTDANQEIEENGFDAVLDFFQNHEFFSGLRTRLSFTTTPIFHRLKVKIKKEIVTMDDASDDFSHDRNENEETGGKNRELQGADQVSEDSEGNATKMSKKEHLKVDPTEIVGSYVKPGKEWDDLLMDPEVVVIDTRNKYEVEIGTFENAISPNTDNFRQFPDWLHRFSAECRNVDSSDNENKVRDGQCVVNSDIVNSALITQTNDNPRSKEPVTTLPKIFRKPKAVAMFCTGGIRCEKSTSYAIAANVFDDGVPVYHLDGGILAYLESHKNPNESKWKGECFVFDQRVALTHGLKPSESYNSCHACRRPVSDEDKKGKDYVHGIHCKQCKDSVTEKQRDRFQDRQKQIELAQKTGIAHIHDPKEIKD